MRRRQLNEVSHCCSMHSADCNTDHALVRCKLALRVRKFHLSHSRPPPSTGCSATKDPVKIKRFQTLLCNHLNSSSPAPKDHEDGWAEFCTAVTDSAVIAFSRPSRKQPDWFRDSADLLLQSFEAKRKARAIVCAHVICNSRLRLTTAKLNMQRLIHTALYRYWTNLSQRIQCCADTGDLHGMYQGIPEAIGPTSKKTATVLSKDSRPISDPGKQLDPWADHFSSLYNKDVPVKLEAINALPLIPTLYELDADIPLGAVKVAIKLLKNNKASGADGIQDFKDVNIITLYKNRGSQQDCNSYQGISLLSVAGKVLSRVLPPRLQVIADRVLPETQCAFRASRSTIDAVFTLRQQEKCIEQQRPLYVAFIDLTKAFDLVSRSALFAIIRRFGCPDTLLNSILKLHDDMHATVQVNGSRSRRFPIKRLVKQGCVLAPTLLAIFFTALLICAFSKPSDVILHCHTSGKLFDLSRFRAKSKVRRLFIWELLHADDAAFVASTLENFCSSFASSCAEFHTTISLSKNVVLSQGPCSSPHISINGAVLQSVDKFCYLGSTVDNTNSLKPELDIRIGKVATTFGQLCRHIWSNCNLSIWVKIQVYRACVVSVLLYGCETWTTYRNQERHLNAFHMRCLGVVLEGPCAQYLKTANDWFLWPHNHHQTSMSTMDWSCVGWRTTACQSKFCIVNYPMLPDRLDVQNCVSGTCWSVT